MNDASGESDVALTLLHTADWHLGRRFPSFEHEQETRLTRARLEVVGRILDVAESRDVDAVLCAGDLFDEPAPEQLWWGRRVARVPNAAIGNGLWCCCQATTIR